MADDDTVCLHCGNAFEGMYSPALVKVKSKPLLLCVTCLGEALRGVLNQRNAGWVRGSTEVVAANFCWLCGDVTDRDKRFPMSVGRDRREIVVCESCKNDSVEIALRFAGLPSNWKTMPRKCATCEHCCNGECCYAIPTVVVESSENGDGEQLPGVFYPKTCRPLVRPSRSTDEEDFGCVEHWAPRLDRKEG